MQNHTKKSSSDADMKKLPVFQTESCVRQLKTGLYLLGRGPLWPLSLAAPGAAPGGSGWLLRTERSPSTGSLLATHTHVCMKTSYRHEKFWCSWHRGKLEPPVLRRVLCNVWQLWCGGRVCRCGGRVCRRGGRVRLEVWPSNAVMRPVEGGGSFSTETVRNQPLLVQVHL